MRKKIFKSVIATFAMMAMLAMPMKSSIVMAAEASARTCAHLHCTAIDSSNDFIFIDYTAHLHRMATTYKCDMCGYEYEVVTLSEKEGHFDEEDGQCACGVFLD